MRQLISISALMVIALFSGCESAVDIKAEAKRLLETDREFARVSVDSGAAEAFRGYLTEDALQLSHGRNPVQGRDQIHLLLLKSRGDYVLDWEPREAHVARSGDLGWTWGIYTLSYPDESGIIRKQGGKYLNIWQKQTDGNWKVRVDMGNENPQ